MPLILLEKECGPKCRSRQHVLKINSIIARGNLKEFQAYSSLCYNWARHSDVFGRTALHLAASCGKTELLEWLLSEKKVDLTTKDMESGYTALHRAVFYGQLSCARLLMQFNPDVQVRDVESLSPLDIAMLDRPVTVSYSLKEPNEAYTWGENNNSTLGHASLHKQTSPEAVDVFKKSGISIKQIVLCKYHCVFLSQSGQVYTCGHGQGGRLGHGDQHTVLEPRLLESIKEWTCVSIAAASDHTLLEMEGGVVFSFGLNRYHQLGQTPVVEDSPVPRQVNIKPLKGKAICGVCVGRFHSVVWTSDSLFTVGLNAGQLGHQKGEKQQSQLRQVSNSRLTDIEIARVTCCDAATVCLTSKGDVYVLHEYQCRKIASKWQEIDRLLVTGGHLDHSAGLDILSEKGGQELNIMMKNESGQLFLWRSNSPSVKRCQFAFKRQLYVSDVAMTTSGILLSTRQGEAFMGYLSNKKMSIQTGKDTESKHNKEYGVKECGDGFSKTSLLDLLLKDEVEEIQVRRLPVIHRAVAVSADRKGKNFAVLQALPNGCMSELPSVTGSEMTSHFGQLLLEADMEDSVHDAVIQVDDRLWPVHQYILAMRSDYFRNIVTANTLPKGEKLVVRVDSVSPDIMEQLIKFIYTDTCDYLQLGFKVQHSHSKYKDLKQQNSSKPKPQLSNEDEFIPAKGMSAFQVQQNRKNQKSGKKEAKRNENEAKSHQEQSQNPIKLLQEAARRMGVKGLSKRLDAVKCINDVITSHGKTLAKPRLKFDRTRLPELYDVTISSEDGQEMQCHKCVLVSRLEYFYSMLATGWVESFNTTTLNLPVSTPVLEVLMDFLYSDEAIQLRDCTSEEFLCNLLIVSDQLLAWRLKEMCEVALANNIVFKNVGDLLEFSTVYNAGQLKASCQQFICLNLAAMLEGRYLDMVSQDILDDLTSYYRSMTPNMAYRVVTPDNDGPSQSYLDDLVAEYESMDPENPQQHQSDQNPAKRGKQQKKRNRTRKQSSSEEPEKMVQATGEGQAGVSRRVDRNLSISSDVSVRSEDDIQAIVEEINRQEEEDEKKLLASVAKTREKMKWRMLEMSDGTSPKAQNLTTMSTPTQPEDIPKWTSSYKTLAWSGKTKQAENSVEPCPSSPSENTVSPPCLATSPTSLRDIMHHQQESQASDKRKNSFSSRISWKDVKKQQSKESKDKQQNPSTSESSENPNPSPKATVNPWASVGGVVKSFRDLMIQEEKVTESSPVATPRVRTASGGSANPSSSGGVRKSPPAGSTSWGLSMPTSRSIPIPAPSRPSGPTSPPAGSENPWQRRAALATSPLLPTSGKALNFSDILQDEKEKTETLVRTTQKPLSLIQLEEQAMNELLTHYKAGKDVERYITVERVSKAMAAPLWRREGKSSGAGL